MTRRHTLRHRLAITLALWLNRAQRRRLAGLLIALALAALVVAVLGASPWHVAELIFTGSFGTPNAAAYVIDAWVPLLFCAAALLLTFAAGMWNIGIEGQIVMGAVFATGALRLWGAILPPAAALAVAALAAILGGALWALLTGALRFWGNVNEIFGGLGLYFVANSLTVWLVLGPWRRAGIASTSGTEPFPPALWLPDCAGFPVGPVELLLALAAFVLVAFLLRGSHFGLRLKALGNNVEASARLGVPAVRQLCGAFVLAGGLAGLAGWTQVVGATSRHQLYPLISNGYGFLAIMVVLCAGFRPWRSLLIALAFAAIAMGSLQLALQLQLDSALGGVIQGLLVLGLLTARGWQWRQRKRKVWQWTR
ncbi:MAG TPA: ABC transporter permease [bacterium]|nr:ABC transporter permease [bacterium]